MRMIDEKESKLNILLDNDKANKFNNNDLFDINDQIIGNNNINNISLVQNVNNNTINDSGIINESINDNFISQFDQSNR